MKIWKDGVIREMTSEELAEMEESDKYILSAEGEAE